MNELTNISNDTQKIICSAPMITKEEKARWFSATNNPDKKIADCANEVILIADFYIEFVECLNEETGEITENVPRLIIMDVDGVSYTATSFVMFNAIKRLVTFYGMPETWDSPRKIKFKQINKGKKRLLSFDVIE